MIDTIAVLLTDWFINDIQVVGKVQDTIGIDTSGNWTTCVDLCLDCSGTVNATIFFNADLGVVL